MALVTIEQARERLDQVNPDHGMSDLQVEALVEAATNAIETSLGRQLSIGRHEEWLDGNGKTQLYVRQTPLISVEFLEVDGHPVQASTGRTTGYSLRGDRIVLIGRHFRKAIANVHLAYMAGYPEIPPALQEACLLTLQAVSTASSMDLNLTGESVPGVYSASYAQAGPGSIPAGAQTLIAPFRRVVLW